MIHVIFWIFIIVGLVIPVDGPSSSSSQSEVKIRVHPFFLWVRFARRRDKKGHALRSAWWVSNNKANEYLPPSVFGKIIVTEPYQHAAIDFLLSVWHYSYSWYKRPSWLMLLREVNSIKVKNSYFTNILNYLLDLLHFYFRTQFFFGLKAGFLLLESFWCLNPTNALDLETLKLFCLKIKISILTLGC